jgi:hypothetical protein
MVAGSGDLRASRGDGFLPTTHKDFGPTRLGRLFANELRALPPAQARTALLEKIRSAVTALQPLLNKCPSTLTPADVTAIRIRASELNDTIRQNQ